MTRNYFFKKGKVGCLLIHGFTGSPNEVLELGKFLAKNDITVSIPTLPGHATHSADMYNYTWYDWFECVKQHYFDLRQKCDKVVVAGLSMGGVLALHLAAHQEMAAVISLAAPVEFPKWQVAGVKAIQQFKNFRYKKNGEDVHDISIRPKLGSYRRFPYYAVNQLFSLVEHVRDDLPEVYQPILIMHAQKDHVIPFSNSELLTQCVGSKEKYKIDLHKSYHIITADCEKELVMQKVLEFIKKHSQ